MSDWAPKRFWAEATAVEVEGGWSVTLDGRPVRTPARAPLVVPTEGLARALAREWDAQDGTVVPAQMPLTRATNSAIDKVAPQFEAVAGLICEYGDTDLICYRADAPQALCDAQSAAWDPLIDWARDTFRAPLVATTGVVPVAQPEGSRAALRAVVTAQDPFALTALHDLVSLSGSLVIGLAAQVGAMPADDLWRRSRIDEHWQRSQWGADAEALDTEERKRIDFLRALEFHGLSRSPA